eukprot:gene4908-5555_t
MDKQCGPLTFFSNFDSGNLSKVEQVTSPEDVVQQKDNVKLTAKPPSPAFDYDYNVWTCPDCMGTEFENANRTWFYFGVKGGQAGKTLQINVMNMNKQGKLYSQGMAPVFKVVPVKEPKWDRIRNRVSYKVVDGQFILTFSYTFPEIRNPTVYFAFCYPHSYKECQKKLSQLDKEYSLQEDGEPSLENHSSPSSIYYHRDLLCYSLDQLRVDLITISSYKGMDDEKEDNIHGLFPEVQSTRANKFKDKKVIFVSARVHPGETPGSFAFNGFMEFILRRSDPRAALLRDKFVFKLVPMLNPDGVSRGYYRTDTRGMNLNRVYVNPDSVLHPSIFAVKRLIVYYHNHYSMDGLTASPAMVDMSYDRQHQGSQGETSLDDQYSNAANGFQSGRSLVVKEESKEAGGDVCNTMEAGYDLQGREIRENEEPSLTNSLPSEIDSTMSAAKPTESDALAASRIIENNSNNRFVDEKLESLDLGLAVNFESGLAVYIDLHGHATKRGCFIYANNFEQEDEQVRCLLFPKLIAINSPNFDFTACNFSMKNMLSKDKRDGMSKEGSGRVAISKITGILHSYTVECNYNTGRITNNVPPAFNDNGRATPPPQTSYPPKYTPDVYAEVGKAMAISVLDLFEINPWSRVLASEFKTIANTKAWLLTYIQQTKAIALSRKITCSLSKKNAGNTDGVVTSPFQCRAAGDVTRTRMMNANQRICSRTNLATKVERKLPRKSSNPKSEASIKPYATTLPGLDDKTISATFKVGKLLAECSLHVQENSHGAVSQTKPEESMPKITQSKKSQSQAVASKSRPQINHITLSLDSSKKLRSKKVISEEIEKRVIATRKKSTNEYIAQRKGLDNLSCYRCVYIEELRKKDSQKFAEKKLTVDGHRREQHGNLGSTSYDVSNILFFSNMLTTFFENHKDY